jgi:hypothetical protein
MESIRKTALLVLVVAPLFLSRFLGVWLIINGLAWLLIVGARPSEATIGFASSRV